MSGAHFDLSNDLFADYASFHRAISQQMKNYTSNQPLSTTASQSGTARNMALGTQAEIFQGVGFYEPKEYVTQIMHDELNSVLNDLRIKDMPFNTSQMLTMPNATSNRVLRESTRKAVTMSFSPIHASQRDDYENLDPPGLESYSNGRLPLEALSPVEGHPGLKLWHEAAAAWSSMRAALLRDGYKNDEDNPMIFSAYRNFDRQYTIYYDANKDNIVTDSERRNYENPEAAEPGTSKHGWGLAIDFHPDFYQDQRGTQNIVGFDWLINNAHMFGFVWPHWAQKSGSNWRSYFEPWHWEYRGHVYI